MLMADWFVGIDWAEDAHDVCIVDRTGRVVERREVLHTASALQAFIEVLFARAQGDASRIALGIEVPRGALVELCVERGLAVYALKVAGQRREAERHLEDLLAALEAETPIPGDQREHSDVAIVRSMPGVGTRVAARMLAEASQPLVDRAYHVLRMWMGVAPVTKRSGRRRRPIVQMRYACNRHLRDAAYHWARTCAQKDPRSRAYYAALRARGHSHGRALRSVADRAVRILVTLLQRGQLFDPHCQPHATAVAMEA